MDWRRLTLEIERAHTLDDAAYGALLSELGGKSPEVAQELDRFVTRARSARSFMQTSVGPQGAPADHLAPGTEVGVWRIVGLLGAGGMGEVYRAERCDGRYEQTVALKLLQGGDPGRTQRFERERQQLARMDHPGISRIIDGGETAEGRPYMAMEFVDGAPIDEAAAAGGLSVTARLRLFTSLCEAVSHAHGRLILHRDIKPANVLVDRDGKVRLIDFGIAALLDDDETGGPLTIAVAAPEQLRREQLSVQTDVFALGCLLHVLLTGKVPERCVDGAVEVDAGAIANPDLAAIAMKATAFRSEDRYPSADALGDDVTACLASQPVMARKGGRLYRIGKSIRRYPLASGLAAAFVVALSAGLAGSLAFADRASHEASRATSALRKAQFYLNAADLNAQTQGAYADLLHRAFGETEDADRLTQFLVSRAREAQDMHDVAPERAALISYAVGENFVDRRDYQTGLAVLEPWIEAGYGAPDLVAAGKRNLALAYRYAGDTDKALSLFRELRAYYRKADIRDEGIVPQEQVLVESEIANITGDRDDYAIAEAMARRALGSAMSPEERIYLYNTIDVASLRQGKFAEAYDAARKSVALIDSNPLTPVAEQGTMRVNVAMYEVYFNGDLDNAERQLDIVDERVESEGGETGTTAVSLGLRADVEFRRGDYEESEALLNEGIALSERYYGPGAFQVVAKKAALIELLATVGRLDEAEIIRKDVDARVAANEPGAWQHPRMTLAIAYLIAKGDGPSAAAPYLEENGITRDAVSVSPVGVYLVNRLADLGVPIA